MKEELQTRLLVHDVWKIWKDELASEVFSNYSVKVYYSKRKATAETSAGYFFILKPTQTINFVIYTRDI